jgi:hypothetical protein
VSESGFVEGLDAPKAEPKLRPDRGRKGERMMDDGELTPTEVARELAQEVNLMDRSQMRDFFRAFVAELDRSSYQQLENAMDVVI